MRPSPLDEYPIHQSTLSLGRVGTSDTRFYDRGYFNGHDHESDTFFVAGLGVYPNLGLSDAFLMVRRDDRLRTLCFSDQVATRRLEQAVGPFRVEVVDPLRRLRLVCDDGPDGLAADLTWHSSFPAVFEPPQLVLGDEAAAHHAAYDTTRFAQVGRWSGELQVDGEQIVVGRETWTGFRDRSWGVRPMGTPTPRGRCRSGGRMASGGPTCRCSSRTSSSWSWPASHRTGSDG
ncbi:hypothetical protein [Nocardioides humi]|uniref:hypothetical protein n=1 Tax=Nocardioides humi TaxID=449461 RepID=UPI001C642885|nr:hypothetical protein [Nocardioides humi]